MTDQNQSLCRRFQMLLSERLDRGLNESELDDLQAHLKDCARCREFASALRLSDQLARESEAVAPLVGDRLEHVVARVMERVEGESVASETEPAAARKARAGQAPPARSWRELFSDWGFPSLAGAVALAVLAFFLLRSPQAPAPTPAGRSLDLPAQRRTEEAAEKKSQATDALKSPATSGETQAERSAPQAPGESETRALGEGATGAPTRNETPAPLEEDKDELAARELRSDRGAAGQEEMAQTAPPSKGATPQAPTAKGKLGTLTDYAIQSARTAQPADSLQALKNLGAFPPLSRSERDSLRAAWSARLKESSDAKEQAKLRAGLSALEKLPPAKN